MPGHRRYARGRMGTDAVETFLALLAVLALAFVVVSAGLAAVRVATGRLPRWAIDAPAAAWLCPRSRWI